MSISTPPQYSPPQGPTGLPFVPDVYNEGFDPRPALGAERTVALQANGLEPTSVGLVVFLSVITLGIYAFFHFLLLSNRLPRVKADDPSAGKAIGFSFIPLFNLYWAFVVWARLARRINLQYRLRGMQGPISINVIMSMQVCNLAGPFVLLIPWIAALILFFVAIVQMQRAVNAIAGAPAVPFPFDPVVQAIPVPSTPPSLWKD